MDGYRIGNPFQLCHVNCIGVFQACRHASNLTGNVIGRVAYRNRCRRGSPGSRVTAGAGVGTVGDYIIACSGRRAAFRYRLASDGYAAVCCYRCFVA